MPSKKKPTGKKPTKKAIQKKPTKTIPLVVGTIPLVVGGRRGALPPTGGRRGALPPTKAVPPAIKLITYSRLPKEPCCTDVLKTGQAYSIPFGFRDLLGTQRLGNEPPKVPEPAVKVPVRVPVKVPVRVPVKVPVRVPVKVPPTKTIPLVVGTIPLAVGGRRGALPPTGGGRGAVVPPTKVAGIPIETQTEPEEKPILRFAISPEEMVSAISVKTPSRIPRKRESTPRILPKKNSMKDLEERYFSIKREPYSGEKLSYTEFRQMVERLEGITKA